jgi:hypothetical protein
MDVLMVFKTQKWLGCWLGAALGASTLFAQQVDVKLTLAYTTYVVGEPVLVQLELLNTMREPIQVGRPDASDSFFVEITKGGRYNELPSVNAAPIIGAVDLKPGQSTLKKVELDKWFSLAAEGKYIARAVFVHNGIRYQSAERSFDVVPGLPLLQGVQMFVNRQSQKRLFKLVHWQRNQTERLFLRIEDEPANKMWDSIDLGVLLRTTDPKLDISPEGEVTILHRATQDAFIRTVLWSLPDSVEVAERNQLLDPEISASQRVRSLYGEMSEDGPKEEKKSWWKFW